MLDISSLVVLFCLYKQMIELYYMVALMIVFMVASFILIDNVQAYSVTKDKCFLRRIVISVSVMVVSFILFRVLYTGLL